MRNEIAEIEETCHLIAEEAAGMLTWRWDDYMGAVLATFKVEQSRDVMLILDHYFSSEWSNRSIDGAPASVQAIAAALGGMRDGQFLFVTSPDDTVMAYAAWWPWGDDETISVRIGLTTGNIPAVDVERYIAEFAACFIKE